MNFEEYKRNVSEIEIDDYAALLNIGRKWKKIEAPTVKNIKVALLGSASIQLVTSVTKALLTKYDLYADVYEGEYNGILMEAMDANSKLYEFAPEYIIILPDYHDIVDQCPTILSDRVAVLEVVEKTKNVYAKMLEMIHSKLPGSQIIISNFVSPFWGNLGNLEANYIFSQKNFFQLLNLSLTENKPSYVSILDMDGLASFIGKKQWFDESAYFLNKSGFALPYIGYVCDLIARQFQAFVGKPNKCLVLDLDNTIWGGIVGDVGYDGIMLDPNDAEGEAYQAFQKYVLALKHRGIILAVCSKNDAENAKEPFEKNSNMILKLGDISSFVANWNDKASNIKLISEELNIGLDSFVFFDDNPTERALVKQFLPEITVIDVPEDPALYVRALDQAYAFEWNQITQEDISRSDSYAQNIERTTLMESCVDYNDYLKKLNMHIQVAAVEEKTLPRFSQLTNKSNQFNVRTQRYSEAEIDEMAKNKNYELLTVSLCDKFTNYGIIACVVLRFEDQVCYIDNWVMSCRVLKKTIENYTAEKIVSEAIKQNVKCIKAEYLRTKKNGMVANLFETLSFEKVDGDDNCSHYVLNSEKMHNYKQTYYVEEN